MTFDIPGLEQPKPPDGYSRGKDGLYIPDVLAAPGQPPTLVLGEKALAACPEDAVSEKRRRDPDYLWSDAAAGLNRVVAHKSLTTIKDTFGELHKLSDLPTLLGKLNQHLQPEKLDMYRSDFYTLLDVVNESAGNHILEDEGIWDYLGVMADFLQIESDMQDLAIDEASLELVLRGLDAEQPAEKLLDFIAHFDIPGEVASRLMDKIDAHPNHPLYWWVAARCPDHPEVNKQQRVARALLANDETAFADSDPRIMLPIGLLLGDEALMPKTGIELETTTFVNQVRVPKGTMMGVDDAKKGDILELRLDHDQDPAVLTYGPAWLKRYFEVWRWEQLARGVSSSIHIHSDGQAERKFVNAQSLFGDDDNSCRKSYYHDTIEVRSALDGYIDDRFDATGYPELPPPAMIELLHMCENPDSLAFFALRRRVGHTNWRTRLGGDFEASHPSLKPEAREEGRRDLAQQFETILEQEWYNISFNSRVAIVSQLANLTPEQQTRVFDMAVEDTSGYVRGTLVNQFANLTPEQQTRVFDMAVEDTSGYVRGTLVNQFANLTPEQQTRVFDMAVEDTSDDVRKALIDQLPYMSSLSENQIARIRELEIINERDSTGRTKLGHNIGRTLASSLGM